MTPEDFCLKLSSLRFNYIYLSKLFNEFILENLYSYFYHYLRVNLPNASISFTNKQPLMKQTKCNLKTKWIKSIPSSYGPSSIYSSFFKISYIILLICKNCIINRKFLNYLFKKRYLTHFIDFIKYLVIQRQC